MNKTKWLWALLILCMLSNGFLLWKSFAGHRHQGKQPHQPKHRIIEALQLDQQQCVSYEELIREHRSAVQSLENQMTQTRSAMYAALADSTQPNAQLVQQVASVQAEMERVHFEHFKAIRALCRPDQLERFNALMVEFPNLFSPHQHGK